MKVVSAKIVRGPFEVFDITVDPCSRYQLAAGIVVSNSKRVSLLDVNALLSHGATETIRDASYIRGQQNDDYWLRFMQGYNPPDPKVPMVYDKFISELKGSGINVVKRGSKLNLMAMTDADIDELAGDREIRSGHTVKFDGNMQPISGGLFDPSLTGGHGSSTWAKITLPQPMLNPAMEEPARRLLNLTQKEFDAAISGDRNIGNFGSGPAAIQKALADLNVDKEIARCRGAIASDKGGKRDRAVRQLGYLKGLQRTGMKPADWVVRSVPVIPPKFRPVSVLGGSGAPVVSDVNYLYKELLDAKDNYAAMVKEVGDEGAGAERTAVYSAFKAVTGLGDPLHPKLLEKGVGGLLQGIFSTSPKFGSVQRKLLASTVDNTGRAVITPEPDYDMDTIGLPADQAMEAYGKFVVRRLRKQGMAPSEIMKAVRDRSKMAMKVLEEEMEERPVIASRAPVLHRFGFMAFKPKLVRGHTMRLNPLVHKGLGADHDGNCVDFDTQLEIAIDKVSLEQDNAGSEFLQLLNEVVMRTPAETKLLVQTDGNLRVLVKIGEFPRIGSPTKDKNGAFVFRVPAGVSIPTYDHVTGRVFDAEITHLTVDVGHPTSRVSTRGRWVDVSDNESVAVFDSETGGLVKAAPKDALGKLVPVVKSIAPPGTEFDRDIGWWYGALVANGWVTERTVGYSKSADICRTEFERVARGIDPNFAQHEYFATKTEGKFADSAKIHLNGIQLVRSTFRAYDSIPYAEIDRGALHKMIPTEILSRGSRECLLGVFSGLLDGDSCVGWNKAAKNPRAICRFNTSSPSLRDTIVVLCRYLGLRTSVTTVPARKKSKESYVVMPSLVDLVAIAGELTPVSEDVKAWLAQFIAAPPAKDNLDIRPITPSLAKALADDITCGDATPYTACRKAIGTGYLGVATAKAMASKLSPGFEHPHWEAFEALVANEAVRWEVVEKVESVGLRDVFDLAIPSTKVFMLANGLVIWDTMVFHAPSTEGAVKEAYEKLMPSKNLLRADDMKTPMHMPDHEYLGGLHYAANAKVKPGGPRRSFRHADDVLAAYARGEIRADDAIDLM